MPLTSLRLLVALGLVAAVLWFYAVLVVRRRVRRYQSLSAVLAACGLVVAAGGVAAGINRHFGLFQSWHALFGLSSRDLVAAGSPQQLTKALRDLPAGAAVPTHGQLLSLTIPSVSSGLAANGSLVYLPPQYGTAAFRGKGFPVVEAIPGSPGNPEDYINGVAADTQLDRAIAAGLLPPVIVVFAPSNTSILRSLECADTADGLRDETYLTADVHDWVTTHLNTTGTPWVSLGYSTGGYCALDLAYRHPELFSRAVSLDGYFHAIDDHYARNIWGYGTLGRQNRLEHSPDWWMTHHGPEPVDVYVSAGNDDRDAARDALSFWNELTATAWFRPADRLVVEAGGHHTFRSWKTAFVPALQWALAPSAAPAVEPSLALKELAAAAAGNCATVAPTPAATTAAASPTASPADGAGGQAAAAGSPSAGPSPTPEVRRTHPCGPVRHRRHVYHPATPTPPPSRSPADPPASSPAPAASPRATPTPSRSPRPTPAPTPTQAG